MNEFKWIPDPDIDPDGEGESVDEISTAQLNIFPIKSTRTDDKGKTFPHKYWRWEVETANSFCSGETDTKTDAKATAERIYKTLSESDK
jgi:hypothetical protein